MGVYHLNSSVLRKKWNILFADWHACGKSKWLQSTGCVDRRWKAPLSLHGNDFSGILIACSNADLHHPWKKKYHTQCGNVLTAGYRPLPANGPYKHFKGDIHYLHRFLKINEGQSLTRRTRCFVINEPLSVDSISRTLFRSSWRDSGMNNARRYRGRDSLDEALRRIKAGE